MPDNRELYETDEVVGKYTANTTRVRSLNNAEKIFIDRFDVKNKDVLVIGSGAGRVPANLLLYGNRVLGIDRSKKLTEAANRSFPQTKFTDLSFKEADAIDLSHIPNESFDVVFFAMNTLDYIDEYSLRERAIKEAASKVKKGGILAYSSHNNRAYLLSPKIQMKDRKLSSLFGKYDFIPESVVGGGVIFKGSPGFIVSSTKNLIGFAFAGYVFDLRTKLDKLFAKSMFFAKFYFPYIVYVFKKEN